MMAQPARMCEDFGTPLPVKKAWFMSPTSKAESSHGTILPLPMHSPTLTTPNGTNSEANEKKKKRRRTVVIRTPYPMRIKMKRSTICGFNHGDLVYQPNLNSRVLPDQTPLRAKQSWASTSNDMDLSNSENIHPNKQQSNASRRCKVNVESHTAAVPMEDVNEFVSWTALNSGGNSKKENNKIVAFNEDHRKLMVCNAKLVEGHPTQRYKQELSLCDAARQLSCELAHMGRRLSDIPGIVPMCNTTDKTICSPYTVPDGSSKRPRRKRVRCKSSISSNISVTPSDEHNKFKQSFVKQSCQGPQNSAQSRRCNISKRRRRISLR